MVWLQPQPSAHRHPHHTASHCILTTIIHGLLLAPHPFTLFTGVTQVLSGIASTTAKRAQTPILNSLVSMAIINSPTHPALTLSHLTLLLLWQILSGVASTTAKRAQTPPPHSLVTGAVKESTVHGEDDYGAVLNLAYLFYEGQMSGKLPEWNRYGIPSWGRLHGGN